MAAPFPTRIDRYIMRKFLGTFLFMVAMLVVIIVVIDISEKTDDFIEKKAPLKAILLDYYANFIPFMANLFSPVCIFLAVIYFTGRMTQQTEIVAILSSGVSFYRLLLPYITVALLLSGFSFYLNGFVVPHATQKWVEFEYRYIKGKGLLESRSIHKKIDDDTFIYIDTYHQLDQRGYRFTLERLQDNRLVYRMEARNIGWVDSLAVWQLYDVQERFLQPQGSHALRQRAQLDTTLNITPRDVYRRDNQEKTLTLAELDAYIKAEQERGSDFIQELELTKQERYAYPLAALILTVMGVSLSTRKSRGGIALQLGLGLILSFLYIVLLTTARVAFAESLPTWVAVWFPNVVFVAVAYGLLRAAPK